MTALPLRRGAILLLALCLAGCSETILRRDTRSEITIDGQPLKTSWVSVASRDIDVIVYAPSDDAGRGKFTANMAERAAGRIAAQRCVFDRVYPDLVPVQFADGQFTFRYKCGK